MLDGECGEDAECPSLTFAEFNSRARNYQPAEQGTTVLLDVCYSFNIVKGSHINVNAIGKYSHG